MTIRLTSPALPLDHPTITARPVPYWMISGLPSELGRHTRSTASPVAQLKTAEPEWWEGLEYRDELSSPGDDLATLALGKAQG